MNEPSQEVRSLSLEILRLEQEFRPMLAKLYAAEHTSIRIPTSIRSLMESINDMKEALELSGISDESFYTSYYINSYGESIGISDAIEKILLYISVNLAMENEHNSLLYEIGTSPLYEDSLDLLNFLHKEIVNCGRKIERHHYILANSIASSMENESRGYKRYFYSKRIYDIINLLKAFEQYEKHDEIKKFNWTAFEESCEDIFGNLASFTKHAENLAQRLTQTINFTPRSVVEDSPIYSWDSDEFLVKCHGIMHDIYSFASDRLNISLKKVEIRYAPEYLEVLMHEALYLPWNLNNRYSGTLFISKKVFEDYAKNNKEYISQVKLCMIHEILGHHLHITSSSITEKSVLEVAYSPVTAEGWACCAELIAADAQEFAGTNLKLLSAFQNLRRVLTALLIISNKFENDESMERVKSIISSIEDIKIRNSLIKSLKRASTQTLDYVLGMVSMERYLRPGGNEWNEEKMKLLSEIGPYDLRIVYSALANR